MITLKYNVDHFLKTEIVMSLIKLTLKKQNGCDRAEYFGSGYIFRNANGALFVKLIGEYSQAQGSTTALMELLDTHNVETGEIIDKQHYYSMIATDISGEEWRSDNVWLTDDSVYGEKGFTIIGKINEAIVGVYKNYTEVKKSYATVVTRSGYNLPWNERIEEGGASYFGVCDLSDVEIKIRVKKNDTYNEIYVEIGDHDDLPLMVSLILEALSIGVGVFIEPLLVEFFSGIEIVGRIYPQKQTSEIQLFPPFPVKAPGDAIFLQQFIKGYLRNINERYSSLFGYWYRFYKVENNEIENQALVITTCIEGVLKKYYNRFSKVDSVFLDIMAHTIKEIKASDIVMDKRAMDAIKSILINANNKAFNTQNTLYELQKIGLIEKELIKSWKAIRHKSHHAGELKFNKKDFQDFYADIISCLELFYTLIIGITGEELVCYEYSKKGASTRIIKHNID